MFDTYKNPEGRIVLKDAELTKAIEDRIACGGSAVYVNAPKQDGFGFTIPYQGAFYFVQGTCTWDTEGFDTLKITKN